MIRGLYTSASGMLVGQTRMEVLANNLANVDTPGYKKDTVLARAFPEMLLRRINDEVPDPSRPGVDRRPVIGRAGTGAGVDEIATLYGQGQIRDTANPYDLALAGEGFLAVQAPAGERYTRQGSLARAADGRLVTRDGLEVLGEAGPIVIKGRDFQVAPDGRVFSGGEEVGRLRVVTFASTAGLRKEGNALFAATAESGAPTPIAGPGVVQGALERANVNPIQEMVEMITTLRAYEANQRAIQVQDESLGRAVNEVGRI